MARKKGVASIAGHALSEPTEHEGEGMTAGSCGKCAAMAIVPNKSP
jgi:hypothetical protein